MIHKLLKGIIIVFAIIGFCTTLKALKKKIKKIINKKSTNKKSIKESVKESIYNGYTKHPLITWFTITIFIAFIYITFCIKANTNTQTCLIKLATPLIATIAAIGAFYSYKNTRRISVHSESNWRNRLFNLLSKNKLNKDDVIYFLSFFNSLNNNDQSSNDYKYKEICNYLLRNEEKANTENEQLSQYFKDLNIDKNSPYRQINHINEKQLTIKEQMIFRAIIQSLLKDDWKTQNK